MTPRQPTLKIYRAVAPAAAWFVERLAPFSAKLQKGLLGRRGLQQRLLERAEDLNGCLWFHAASVGEYEQARPIISEMRRRGHGPIAVTHFSPSGVTYAQDNRSGDLHDYLPLDRFADMSALIKAWRPRALIFVKYDCWPNLMMAAQANDVPIFLLAASLPPRSWRLSRPLRPFFRSVYDLCTSIGTGHPADADRFRLLLGPRARVQVTGDTRAKQVIIRFESSAGGALVGILKRWGERRLVLGSTWPADEQLWWPILPTLLEAQPKLNLVLVPHEPHPHRLRDIEAILSRLAISSRRLSDIDHDPDSLQGARCLLVDRVGVLAEIYHAASLTYVGGSFTTGVHSTLEPAISASPVLFGPRIDNAEEALELVSRQAGRLLRTPREALQAAMDYLADDEMRANAGNRARELVLGQRGAAVRSADLIEEVLASQSR